MGSISKKEKNDFIIFFENIKSNNLLNISLFCSKLIPKNINLNEYNKSLFVLISYSGFLLIIDFI